MKALPTALSFCIIALVGVPDSASHPPPSLRMCLGNQEAAQGLGIPCILITDWDAAAGPWPWGMNQGNRKALPVTVPFK